MPLPSEPFVFLLSASSQALIQAQEHARNLLFEKFPSDDPEKAVLSSDPMLGRVIDILSDTSKVFPLSAVQKETYHIDSGTGFIPGGMKKMLLKIKSRFVVPPGIPANMQKIVACAYQQRIWYTVCGASHGNMLFFGPYLRLNPRQYTHEKRVEIDTPVWDRWRKMVRDTLLMVGIEIGEGVFYG